MKQTVTVVTTTIAGKKMYLSEMSLREDNKLLPSWCQDINEAHHFEDEPDARSKIFRFVNNHDRVFFTEEVEVITQRRNPFPKHVYEKRELN